MLMVWVYVCYDGMAVQYLDIQLAFVQGWEVKENIEKKHAKNSINYLGDRLNIDRGVVIMYTQKKE